MYKKIINYTFLLAFLFIILSDNINAAPPEYVSDPDCNVKGVVKGFEFEGVDRETEHYKECQKLVPTVTDCEWIGEDGYTVALEVTNVYNDQSKEDDVICKNIYPANNQRRFFIEEKLFGDIIREGDVIFGKVIRGGEFVSVEMVDAEEALSSEKLNFNTSQNVSHSLNKNKLFVITSLFIIIAFLVYFLFKRIK